MVEFSNFADFILPPADQMATAVTHSLRYHLYISKGQPGLHALHSSLTTAGVDATGLPTKAALTTDGLDGIGAIALGSEADTCTDARKVVLSLTSPLPLLYTTTLQKITIYMMPDPINPRVLHIYPLPHPTFEEGEVLPPKPIPHTQAAIIRTDLVTGLVAATMWSSSGLPLPKKSRQERHPQSTKRHKIIFASVALYAHLLGSSAKLTTPVDRSSYRPCATNMLLRLHTSTKHRPHVTLS
jgi:hypothetical protein